NNLDDCSMIDLFGEPVSSCPVTTKFVEGGIQLESSVATVSVQTPLPETLHGRPIHQLIRILITKAGELMVFMPDQDAVVGHLLKGEATSIPAGEWYLRRMLEQTPPEVFAAG